MEQAPKKPGFWERAGNFLEKLHYAIGTVALGGFAAEEVSGIALVRPDLLLGVGLIEVGEGLVIGGIKNWIKNRGKSRQAVAAPAPA